MKQTVLGEVNGAQLTKSVVRSSYIQRDSAGTKIGRVQRSETVYYATKAGRVIPCRSLAEARCAAESM